MELQADRLEEIAERLGLGREAEPAADWIDPGVPWPAEIDRAAFYGLAGDFVRAVEPHSEADPVAILIYTLAFFGNVVGPSPYCSAEEDVHPAKLFAVLVGETSKGRKDVAAGRARKIFGCVDTS